MKNFASNNKALWIARLILVLSLIGIPQVGQAVALQEPGFSQPNQAIRPALDAAPEGDTFTARIPAQVDAYIDSANPTINFGSDPKLWVSYESTLVNYKYTLLRFDLSSLPANAVVVNATLSLYATSGSTAANVAIASANSAWLESTVNWNTRPANTARGDATQACAAAGWTYFDVDNTASGWVDGSYENNGFVLSTKTSGGGCKWESREAGTVNLPYLLVEYRSEGSPLLLPVQQDTYVNEAAQGTNYGDVSPVIVSESITGNTQWTLLDFNLASLPVNVDITQATLSLYNEVNLIFAPNAPEALSIQPVALVSAWEEDSVTWSSKPAGSNRGDAAVGYVATGWTVMDVTNIVEDWSSGAIEEYGIGLIPARSSTGTAEFWALPSYSAARLEISYSVRPVTGVSINGPTSGLKGIAYTFSGVVSPADATLPVSYAWSATDQSSSNTPEVTYTWNAPGTKTIDLTAANSGGSANVQLQVTISDPPPACPDPLTGLSLSGPGTGAAGRPYTYTATTFPPSATTPITYTWTATDQSTIVRQTSSVTDDQDFTWASTGAKQVAVSAQNCGGSFQTSQLVEILPPAGLPDLQVSSIWYEPAVNQIGYIVENSGGSTAAGDTTTRIYQDDAEYASAVLASSVPAGGLRASTISTVWACAGESAVVKVCVDDAGIVEEGSEDNNCYSETWSCDQTPPTFVISPIATNIAEQTADITLKASEDVQAILTYGYIPGQETAVQHTTPDDVHIFNLSNLIQSQTYFYSVDIIDSNGLVASSARRYFTTLALGSTAPVNTGVQVAPNPTVTFEFFDVTSAWTAPHAIESVQYSMIYRSNPTNQASVVLGTATTRPDFKLTISPAALGLTRQQFFGDYAPIRIFARATSLGGVEGAGNQSFDLVDLGILNKLNIISPALNEQISVPSLPAPVGARYTARMYAEVYQWKCTPGGSSQGLTLPPGMSGVDCADVSGPVNGVKIFLDGSNDPNTLSTEDGMRQIYLPFKLDGLAGGTHTLQACVYVDDVQKACDSTQFNLVQAAAALQVTRSVARHGSYFTVEFKVKNLTDLNLRLYTFEDHSMLFQAGVVETPSGAKMETSIMPTTGQASSTFFQEDPLGNALPLTTLSPLEEYTLRYRASPAMLPELDFSAYRIGNKPLSIGYSVGSSTTRLTQQVWAEADSSLIAGTSTTETIAQAVESAIASSDYLLVTHPIQLILETGWITGTQVLERMAHLASLRNGVLGYVGANGEWILDTAVVLDDLVEHDGAWAQALHPDFSVKNKGYMLLVGGGQIIPGFKAKSDEFVTYPEVPDYVDYSDLRYANTAGNTLRPEIALGRIPWLGQSMAGVKAFDTMIGVLSGLPGYAYDGSYALVVATGGNEGTLESIEEIIHETGLDGMALALAVTGKPHEVLDKVGSDAPVADWIDEFIAKAQGKSLIEWIGHGNTSGWGPLKTNTISLMTEFGYTAPVLMGNSCLTGAYQESDLVPTALSGGAAVYIGSTAISEMWTNSFTAPVFAGLWGAGQPAGVALNNTKIAAWDNDGPIYDNGKLWAFEYHLFGDPKLGYPGGLASLFARPVGPEVPEAPTTVIDVTLPMYTVNTVGEIETADIVSIDGGGLLLNPGEYVTPIYVITQEYPAGTQVVTVTLISRSEPLPATGLNLTRHYITYPCDGEDCPAPPETPPAQTTGWYPALDTPYSWRTERDAGSGNQDGSQRLTITIYPFFYQVESTDVLYYTDYSFQVDVVETQAELAYVQLDQGRYSLDEPVKINLGVQNDGAPDDFLVEATLRLAGDAPALDGLPLTALHDVTGTVHVEYEFTNTNLLESGWYVIDVRLLDGSGEVELDREVVDFRYGLAAVETTLLEADTTLIKAGTPLQLSMAYTSQGETEVDGTAVILVQDTSGNVLATFEQDFTNLAPGGAGEYSAAWDTTGADGDYWASAYVRYEGMASPSKKLTLSTQAKVYLPFTMK